MYLSFQWVLSRQSTNSKAYKNELQKLENELKKIDDEKEREKIEKEKKDNSKKQSLANGIKSFCIYVPRFPKFRFLNDIFNLFCIIQ